MGCSCPYREKPDPPPERTEYQVVSDGEVVFRTPDQAQADTVSKRWPGGTVRPVTVR